MLHIYMFKSLHSAFHWISNLFGYNYQIKNDSLFNFVGANSKDLLFTADSAGSEQQGANAIKILLLARWGMHAVNPNTHKADLKAS